uniref:Uncharacterized protein n=1 Tax=Arundo donax TaxID=35708 RepID=A0A0A9DMR9_ARUDO
MHIKSTRIKISNNTPPPAAIAIITPVLIFLQKLFLVLLGDDGDTGEGEGAVPEHGSNGTPHRKAFPKKELAGNFCREGGIGPLRLLLLKFKCLNLGSWRPGMGPESELFWRSNAVS